MIFFKRNIKSKITKWEKQGLYEEILPYLKSDTYSVRIKAIQSLGNIKNDKVVDELIKLLDDPNKFIRREVENALLKLNPSDKIIKLIEDKKEEIKQQEVRKKDSKRKSDPTIEIDKDLYSFKGRFRGNMPKVEAIKEKLKKPLRWG